MADSFTKKYVYPANWSGSVPGPEGPGEKHVEVLLTFRSTGTTGLTGQMVLDPAEWRLQGQAGACELATRLGIDFVNWDINSKIDYVRFYWERAPLEDIFVCCLGQGERNFRHVGGLWDNTDASGDATGKLLMDTVGVADKGAFSIQLNILLDK